MKKSKSPLKASPLNVPGQSIDRALSNYVDDNFLIPLLVIVFSWMLAVLEWWRAIYDRPPAPWAATIIALVATLPALAWMWRSFRIAKQLRLGRDGERFVASYLENLRPLGFWVYHDIPNGDANIDHVLIGTRGIYTIETKTLSKPERGECKIRVESGGITANGVPLDRNPIVQAKAQAGWLKGFLGDAGFKCKVQPVVVFPGWFVEPHDRSEIGVWLLEPKALESFVENQPELIPRERVMAMAAILASFVRAQSAIRD